MDLLRSDIGKEWHNMSCSVDAFAFWDAGKFMSSLLLSGTPTMSERTNNVTRKI